MKKRILSLFLALVLLLSVVPAVSAEGDYQLTYEVYTDSVTHEQGATIIGYTGTLPEKLVIPETIDGYPVRTINDGVFSEAPIKEVVLPGTMLYLNTVAFELNETLETVTIGEGVKSVWRAFNFCSKLKSVTLPSTLEEIGFRAFAQTALESVDLPAGLKTIGEEAFFNSHLQTINLPEGLERIDDGAFQNNESSGRLIIPTSVTHLGSSCFRGNNFSSVIILPEDIDIWTYSFDRDYVIYAHKCVFENNNGISFMDRNILISLEEIPFDIVTEPIITEGDFRYATVDGKAYLVSCGATGEAAVPDTLGGCPVAELLPCAFANNRGLTKLTLPDCVEKIGSLCFSGCSALRELVLPKNLKEYGENIFGYENDIPENLTVYGYADSPLLVYCVDMRIPYVYLETGEPAPALYETTVDGVIYKVNPVSNTATVIGCDSDVLDTVLVLPETVDGASVTKLETTALDSLACVGVILPDTLTYIAEYAISSYSERLLFICMPNNEVFLEQGWIEHSAVSYYFLPENFALAEGCREDADNYFRSMCIGYEKHKAFLDDNNVIPIDGTPEEQLMLTPDGVFRLDDKEYTAIYLVNVDPMPSSIGGVPITRVAASCKIDSYTVILGSYVRVVEDGALRSDADQVRQLYVPDCIEYLPADFYPVEFPCTIYGTSGGYAEKYAKEHRQKFAAVDQTPFSDVAQSAWYFPYVHDVYWYGLMNGTSATTFEPNGTTTRAMVVQVLFNLAGDSQNLPIVYIFDDVKRDDWYFLAVTWAALTGISTGTTATTFSPNAPVTREQLAAFLYRFTTLCGIDCKADGDLSKFADQGQISGYAKDAISWAVGAGIINGKSPTTVAPRAYATRAEIAAMLCRLLDYIDANLAGA